MDPLYSLRKVSVFLFLYFSGTALAGLVSATATKPSLHFALRRFHGQAGDIFFRYYTHIGTAFVFAAVLVVFLALRRWKTSAALALAFGGASVATQGLKHLIEAPRPWFYFARLAKENPIYGGMKLWVPEGVDLAAKTSPSFPSGHATTAAVLFLGFAFLAGRTRLSHVLARLVQFACLGALVLVAYSRVYLSFHFIEDVLVGSLIGVLATCAAFPLVDYVWERFSLPLGKDRLGEGA